MPLFLLALAALRLWAPPALAQGGEKEDAFAREVKAAASGKTAGESSSAAPMGPDKDKALAAELKLIKGDAHLRKLRDGDGFDKEKEREAAVERAGGRVQDVHSRSKKGRGVSRDSGGSSKDDSRRSSHAPAPPSSTTPADAGPPGSPQNRAMKKALKTADSFQRELRQAEDPGPGGTSATDGAPPGKPGGGSTNPANPKTAQDLALASVSGFSASFRALGLKAGAGPAGEAVILRTDGSAASQEEVSQLSERIASEPAALMRQPDFFSVLPRKKFEQLKTEYAAKPALRGTAFKHIGLTGGSRDFQWSDSCSRLSGQCNPHARSLSYKKGDDVPAEDLSALWAKLAAEDEEEASEYTDEEEKERDERRRQRAAADKRLDLSAAGRMLSSLSSGLSKLFGDFGRGSPPSGIGGEPRLQDTPDLVVADQTDIRSASGRARAFAEGQDKGLRRGGPPSPIHEKNQARPTGRAWLLLVIGLLLTLAAAWRRRRR